MPQRDTSDVNRDSGADPLLNMTLWPNRSLEKKSFYILIIMTLSAMMIPIIPFLGTNFLLVILPFSLVTVLLLFLSIALNYETGKLYENVKIWPDLIEVKRYERNGVLKHWKANPYWIKVTLYEEDQKIQILKLYLSKSSNSLCIREILSSRMI